MPLIDFKEIPKANIASGEQDSFELFAKEFFKSLGFKIDSSPDRGADDGKDLIIIEKVIGGLSESEKRWLVSCKHYAHSGHSISSEIESNISDRVSQHKCDGFIAFYSTLPSSGLNRRFSDFKDKLNIVVFDSAEIEERLLNNKDAYKLINRFFPKSFEKMNLKKPSNLLGNYEPLTCECCGIDVLNSQGKNGIGTMIGFVKKENDVIENIYVACKGDCDKKIREELRQKDFYTTWNSINDLLIPYKYLEFNIAIMNQLRNSEEEYKDEAFNKLKEIIVSLSQVVMKNQNLKDFERIKMLQFVPDGL